MFIPYDFQVNSGLYADLGSNSGVFIFTDHGGDRIECAVPGRRWKGEEPRVQNENDVVEESGACDIIVEAHERIELPVDSDTEFDHRYKGIGEFAAERDPKRIAVNHLDKRGPHVTSPSSDGILHTDYILLTEEPGEQYAKRLVSSEYLMYDYVQRPVESGLAMYKKIRTWIDEDRERKFAEIVPGVTTRNGREIQRGDFISISGGFEGEYNPPE